MGLLLKGSSLLACNDLMLAAVTMQISHMQRAAETFVSSEALAVVVALVVAPLERLPRMTEEDAMMVQLVMAFLRNLVTLPDPPLTAGVTWSPI